MHAHKACIQGPTSDQLDTMQHTCFQQSSHRVPCVSISAVVLIPQQQFHHLLRVVGVPCDLLLPYMQARRKSEKATLQREAGKLQTRLLGAMRRLVYSADQLSAKNATLKERDAYINRLECQIIQRRSSRHKILAKAGQDTGSSKCTSPARPRECSHGVVRNAHASASPLLGSPKQGDNDKGSLAPDKVAERPAWDAHGADITPQLHWQQAQPLPHAQEGYHGSLHAGSAEPLQKCGTFSDGRTAACARQSISNGGSARCRPTSRSPQGSYQPRAFGHALNSAGQTEDAEVGADCPHIPCPSQHGVPARRAAATSGPYAVQTMSQGSLQDDTQGDAPSQLANIVPSLRGTRVQEFVEVGT
jgi:hypothetical protein